MDQNGNIGIFCSIISNTSITPSNSAATVSNSSASVRTPSRKIISTFVSGINSSASIATQCSTINVPGEAKNLMISKELGYLVLSWDAPGGACSVSSFSVYRGNLQISGYDNFPLACNITSTTFIDANDSDNYYYLIVPNNDAFEGSYGKSFNGTGWNEIPQSPFPCQTQNINPC